MCKRRDTALGRLSAQELLRRYKAVSRLEAEDMRSRDQSRAEGRLDEADGFCAQAEHRRGWRTSYRREIFRRTDAPLIA